MFFFHVGHYGVLSRVLCVVLQVLVFVSRPAVTDALQHYGLELTRLLGPWSSPGKNTGVGCQFLLQGVFLNPGIKPASPELASRFFTRATWEGPSLPLVSA